MMTEIEANVAVLLAGFDAFWARSKREPFIHLQWIGRDKHEYPWLRLGQFMGNTNTEAPPEALEGVIAYEAVWGSAEPVWRRVYTFRPTDPTTYPKGLRPCEAVVIESIRAGEQPVYWGDVPEQRAAA